jgi:putative ABC transport system permease protein
MRGLDSLAQDLRYGARTFLRRPGFTLAAIGSLALGIGVTTALFTVLNAVALRQLPYADGDRLLWMTEILHSNSTDEVTVTSHFLEWRKQNRSFTALAGFNYATRSLTGIDEPLEAHTARVSATLLPLLGVRPALGRNFSQDEDYKGRDQVAILTDEMWRQHFGADPNVAGRSITLDGSQYAVVGVLPPDFLFPGPDPVQVLTPLAKDEAAELQHKQASIIFNVIGRLKPGVTASRALAELTVIEERLEPLPFHPTITIKAEPVREHLFGNLKTASLLLLAAAAFLLMISTANVSNLLLARLMQRDRELAIRTVLGGSRTRLVSQLLTEGALLGTVACAAGAALGYWLRTPLLWLSPYRTAGLDHLPFDARVSVFAVAISMLTTLIFGLAPALRVTESRLAEAIKSGAASITGGRGALRALSMVAACEIATVLILSTCAGLMLQSFWKMRYANLGFEPSQVVTATINLSASRYRQPAQQLAFIEQLLNRAQAIPGVQSAAVTQSSELPPGDWHATNLFEIEGLAQAPQGHRPFARYPSVSSAYFRIMRIPLLRGRLFNDSDNQTATPIAVVNQALTNRYFARENPIGRRIRTGGADTPWRTIVGIAGDVKTSGLAAAPEPTAYFPYRQTGLASVGLVLQSALGSAVIANQLRAQVAALDPSLPVASIQTMDQRLTESVAKPRFTAALLAAFAALALLLGIAGIYGVMGCRLRWQFRELAVRQALGAQPGEIVRHVLKQGAAIIAPGFCLGLAGSLAATRGMRSMLYEISPADPATFLGVSAVLVAVALLACWIPAVRASRMDPLAALRQD